MKKYSVLYGISVLLRIFGVIVLIGGVAISVMVLDGTIHNQYQQFLDTAKYVIGISGLIGTVIMAVLIYAFGEIIDCFISIEENTRKTNNILLKEKSGN